jgi:ABC-type nitrate/sulfonate/bicarbonate transport system substrate-binding protein
LEDRSCSALFVLSQIPSIGRKKCAPWQAEPNAEINRVMQQRNRQANKAGSNRMAREILALNILCAAIVFLLLIPARSRCELAAIRIAYATTSGVRLPLFIAADAGLFEKHGLDAKLVNIPSGNTAISALVTGEIDVISGSGSAAIVAAGRGLPVMIVGSFGSTVYKLVAIPGITDLRGKTVGTSRPGTTTDFALRRALLKLGWVPDRDVKILSTGIGEADKRIMLMLQGRMDATLASPESILAAETQTKVKLASLADLEELKIYNTVGDLSVKTDSLRTRRDLLRGFFMACSEAIWLGKKDRMTAQKVIGKYLRTSDRKRIETIYDASLGRMPAKPYAREEAIQLEIENVAYSDPGFKNRKASDFVDNSIVAELERTGFFARLH